MTKTNIKRSRTKGGEIFEACKFSSANFYKELIDEFGLLTNISEVL